MSRRRWSTTNHLNKFQRFFLISVLLAFGLGFYLRGYSPYPSSPPVSRSEFQDGTYMVSRVIDGDTVELSGNIRIRYRGIDAPEQGERFADASRDLNDSLVGGKEVYIETEDELYDTFGRVLGHIWVDDELINEKLIEEGYAKVYTYRGSVQSKYADRLLEAQSRAQQSHRGMWVQDW